MPQRDVVAELRRAQLTAPADLRATVRLIAADAAPPPRPRVSRRAVLAVALPLAAALAAAAGVLLTRPAHERTATPTVEHGSAAAPKPGRSLPSTATQAAPFTVPPARNRAQLYDATLSLQLTDPKAVSDAVKRALRITASLSGYPTSVHAGSHGAGATADLVLKVPRPHVQEALTRLSALGTIVGEHVDVQDAEAGLNATDRTIARLQRTLKALRAQSPAPEKQIAALEARIAALQRNQAATRRAAHYATVDVHLATAPAPETKTGGHGPLHGVGVALRWLGIGAVYALAVGGPVVILVLAVFLIARRLRRRREDALLSRS
jgi:Domain of unknown function (DUF4349)